MILKKIPKSVALLIVSVLNGIIVRLHYFSTVPGLVVTFIKGQLMFSIYLCSFDTRKIKDAVQNFPEHVPIIQMVILLIDFTKYYIVLCSHWLAILLRKISYTKEKFLLFRASNSIPQSGFPKLAPHRNFRFIQFLNGGQ